MKKVFDQTVRDIKRGVNKNVLKVPGIERKVLDATSNESWGPHGAVLSDIAHASKNYNDYEMIMTVIWKRINDTGKNWRHVYKGLTVLEYLVANGSERVIEEIKEHAYQISTLSNFQYIDSNGRDQGSNVRKKSQSLVILVNDKERIQEVRQKAAANRDKFRSDSKGGMYKPSSYSSSGGYGERNDEERYGSREDDRNGSRDDNSGREYEERYGRDGYKDDDYQGTRRSVDDYNYNSRGRSSDRDKDRAYDDDAQSSSRGSNARADEHSHDGRGGLDRKNSENNLDAPPSYEEAVTDALSPVHSERGTETSTAPASKLGSPPASSSPSQATTAAHGPSTFPTNQEVDTFDSFDAFDPRGSVSGAPSTGNGVEMDLLGSLTESFSSDALALVPSSNVSSEADVFPNSGLGATFSATSSVMNQSFEDPFGETPFKATPSPDTGFSAQPQGPSFNQISEPSQPFAPKVDESSNFNFEDSFLGLSYNTSTVPSANLQFMSQQDISLPSQDIDILADILPPSGPSHSSYPAQQNANNNPQMFNQQSGFNPQQPPSGPPPMPQNTGFLPDSGFTNIAPPQAQASYQSPYATAPVASHMAPQSQAGSSFLQQSPFTTGPSQVQAGSSFLQQSPYTTGPSASHMGSPQVQAGSNFFQQSPYTTAPVASHMVAPQPVGGAVQNNDFLGNLLPQVGPTNSMHSVSSDSALMGQQLALVPQPSNDKFATKSTVWADTLNRGLVNLNISGSKTNPLADIGIDFAAINRKEKRMEKPSAAPVVSNISMGKAMGSGSGIGRAGAGAIRPSPTPMMTPGTGMGMGGAPGMGMGMGMGGHPGVSMGMGMGGPPGMAMGFGGAGMGMGGYGMNQQQQQPMGMMGMGMNPAGSQMQPQGGMPPPGSTMNGSGGYNSMMGGGGGGYAHQPYGGGGGSYGRG